MRLKSLDLLPPTLREQLTLIGEGLGIARRRRRWSLRAAAKRFSATPGTLQRMERGDPTVSFGLYALALSVYGYDPQLRTLGRPELDVEGQRLEQQRLLPKRQRLETARYDF